MYTRPSAQTYARRQNFRLSGWRRPLKSPTLELRPSNLSLKSMRLRIFIFYITITILAFTLPKTAASPHSLPRSSRLLQNRQAIPDRFGNTGNGPAVIESVSPLAPFQPSSSPTITSTLTPTSTIISSPKPTSFITGADGNSSNNDPTPSTPPAEGLPLTRTNPIISPGTLVGIVAGGAVFLVALMILVVVLLRRKRRPQIDEIAIRPSKIGSFLRHRVFNSPLPPSRASSRSSGHTLIGESRKGGLRKDIISRPAPTKWEEGEMLAVPQAAFMKSESDAVEDGEKWIDKATISEPRPARPASAEPLGRLSGMGLGMGYLK